MKVLLAIDGSVPSYAAVAEVARGRWSPDAEIRILTVIHSAIPLLPDPAFVIAAMHVEEAEDLRQRAPMLLDIAAEQVGREAPGVSVLTKVVEGVPYDAIVQEARDWGADLIVVGSHGYGRARRLLLGSVASAVVAEAPCSVLVARTKQVALGAQSAA